MYIGERICAYYSHGPHYRRVLKYLRATHPGAHLTAMVPPRYPHDALEGLADAIEVTAREHYGARDVAGNLALLKQIRAGRHDRFVVMFDSPKLRLLALLTRVKTRCCRTVDGRYEPIKLSLFSLALDALYRNVRGRITYAYIRHVVYHRPVHKNSGKPAP